MTSKATPKKAQTNTAPNDAQFQITETATTPLSRSFDVVIAHNVMEDKIDAELLELGKQVKISGFRPGKVPLPVLRKRYRDNVLRDALNETVEAALQATITQHSLTPAMMPDIKIEQYSEGEPLKLSIHVELMPEVNAIDFSQMTLEKPVIRISEDAVTEEMMRIAKNQRTLTPKGEDAVAEAGDVVTIDFTGYIDDVAFEGGAAQYFDLELGAKQFIDTFEEQLIGSKAGEERTVNVTFPADYGKAEFAGKPARFEVKVHHVNVMKLPEIDDAFAEKLGFGTLDALREFFTSMMERQYSGMTRDFIKKRLFDQLESACNFDVPAKMLELEQKEIASQMEKAKQQGDDAESLDEAEAVNIARRRVQLGILLSDIAKKNSITVTQDELNNAVIERVRQYPNEQKRILDFYRKNPERMQALAGPILEEKTVDFILTQMKVTETPCSMEEFEAMEAAETAEPKAKTPTKTTKKSASKAKENKEAAA
jgi:trigger factor